MKFLGVGVLAALVTTAAAKRGCGRPPSSTLVTSTASAVPASSSVVSATSAPSSSMLSISVPTISAPSSSTPASSSAPLSSSEPTCGGGECLAAITIEPIIGDVFCSSWLSQTPETTVVTETATVTSTRTNLATVSTVLTLTTATTTKISGTTLIFQKRAPASSVTPDPSAAILSQCSYASSRVSSACSCYLSTTSTVTVIETATETLVPEYTSTVVEISTTKVMATVEAQATATIAAQPILNPDFESYVTTGNIAPWTQSPNGGRIEIINGVNPCTAAGVCAGGRVVVRVYPPTSGTRYSSIQETFTAKPATKYAVNFMYRCLGYDSTSRIDTYYKGAMIGSTVCNSPGAAFATPVPGAITFTTDEVAVGEIEFRFMNPSGLENLYMYADKFEATRV